MSDKNPESIKCPLCKQKKGKPCSSVLGGMNHQERILAVGGKVGP